MDAVIKECEHVRRFWDLMSDMRHLFYEKMQSLQHVYRNERRNNKPNEPELSAFRPRCQRPLTKEASKDGIDRTVRIM